MAKTNPKIEAPPSDHGNKLLTHQKVTDPADLDAAPSSRKSLWRELRQVRNPGGFLGFIRKVFGIVIRTNEAQVTTAIIGLGLIIVIVIGSLHFHECPKEPYIPRFLLAGSLYLLAEIIKYFYDRFRERRKNKEVTILPRWLYTTQILLRGIIASIVLIIFIKGACLCYGQFYRLSFDPSTGTVYCDRVLFLTAFFVNSIVFVIICIWAIISTCFACFIVLYFCYNAYCVPEEEEETESP